MAAETIYLAGNSPDIVVLCLGAKSGLVHFFKDFMLVNGSTILGHAILRKLCAESGNEARIKAINKCLVHADWEDFLVHEQAGGGKDLSVVVIYQGEDGIAFRVVVRLPNMVKGGVGLLGVSGAELIE